MVELTDAPIDAEKLLSDSRSANCGAVLLFLGTTRRWTADQRTDYLVYDAYKEMALHQMAALESEAKGKWPIESVWIVHRLGRVDVSEASVAIVVASPHRRAAFEAGQWLIDELKCRVPIWKQDFVEGENPKWVHPPPPPTS